MGACYHQITATAAKPRRAPDMTHADRSRRGFRGAGSVLEAEPLVDPVVLAIAVGAASLLVGGGSVYLVTHAGANAILRRAEADARRTLDEAENRARATELEAEKRAIQ